VDAETRRLYLPCLRDPAHPDPGNRAIGYLDLDEQGLPVLTNGQARPSEFLNTDQISAVPGHGWAILATNRVVCGAHGTLIFWDQADRASRCQVFIAAPYHPQVIAGHPNGELLYVIYIQQTLYEVELADGRPTLQPRYLDLLGLSLPVVMARRQRLAIGHRDRVSLVNLNDGGRITGEYSHVTAPGFRGTALYYSPRFDRLYIAVENIP
ncbi:hypothetical protein HQ590_02930, partial [bacterium]|nr:hypothetical protein [bacterium]